MSSNMQYDSFDEQADFYEEQPASFTASQRGREPIPAIRTWTKQEKIIVSVFAFVGVGVLVLGGFSFYHNKTLTAYDVFGRPTEGGEQQQEATRLLGSGSSTQTDLRAVDTDKDGLSDYDELNIYQTSPYIEDSDSDGDSDYAEVQVGADPNCPKGTQCAFQPTQNPENQGAFAQPTEQPNYEQTISSGGLNTLSALEQGLVQGTLEPNQLRELLKQNGATDDILSQVSDEQLQSLYTELVAPSTEAGLETRLIDAYTDLAPADVRALLIQSGMDQATIDSLTDEQVMAAYEDVLQQLQQ